MYRNEKKDDLDKIMEWIDRNKKKSLQYAILLFALLMVVYIIIDYNGFFSWFTAKINFSYFELFFNTSILIISGWFTYILVTRKSSTRTLKATDTVLKYTKIVAKNIQCSWNEREESTKRIYELIERDGKDKSKKDLYQHPFFIYSGTINSIEAERIIKPECFENYHELERLWAKLVDYEVERVASGRESFSEEEQKEISKILKRISIIATERKDDGIGISKAEEVNQNSKENSSKIKEEQNV